jgi:ATP-binding cassette subfamily B protein
MIDADLLWPKASPSQAIAAVAQAARLPTTPNDTWGTQSVERAAAACGLEAEAVAVDYAGVDAFVRAAGPALVSLGDAGFVGLVGRRRRSVVVVGRDLRVRAIPVAWLRDAIGGPCESPIVAEVDALLDEARTPARRRARARSALLRERLGERRIEAGWVLRPAVGAPVRHVLRWSRVVRRIGLLATAHALQYALGLVGWWMIGRGALDGRLDRAWLLAWALVLVTQIPLVLATTYSEGMAAVDAGALLKQRLLAGALRVPADAVRTQGAGQRLGCVFEAEAVESLASNAGFLGLVAVLELALATVVLGLGAARALHLPLLAIAVAAGAATAARYLRRAAAWTDERIAITHDVVEQMVGHRTRLAQQHPAAWHTGEDAALARYLDASARMDGQAAALAAWLPRGWVVMGLAGLAPAFVGGTASTASLAVAMGGVLLAHRALRKLVLGAASLGGAVIAWRRVAPMFEAAAHSGDPPGPEARDSKAPRDSRRPLLEASDVTFAYGERPVLRGCTLQICAGDRVLLEGKSGSGKSTLGAVLAGLREARSGLLLAGGFDRRTLGAAAWRRRIVAAPQFHENHVLSATFAFNLLMGREWPPTAEDLQLAEQVCGELDLGPLLERMPAGLHQMVGETGWQLSHGERSRLFLARAILQGAEVVVLDESFAALDPQTLERSMRCAFARTNALVVIAHP